MNLSTNDLDHYFLLFFNMFFCFEIKRCHKSHTGLPVCMRFMDGMHGVLNKGIIALK